VFGAGLEPVLGDEDCVGRGGTVTIAARYDPGRDGSDFAPVSSGQKAGTGWVRMDIVVDH